MKRAFRASARVTVAQQGEVNVSDLRTLEVEKVKRVFMKRS